MLLFRLDFEINNAQTNNQYILLSISLRKINK